ncbi:hypothetical protein BDN70DRAFT_709576 [Pholiota conissans]|uniref:Transcription factor IIIC 90kDa subunit N-terminal domain-containing protein n=1 Tax=Pholiota conissans TaxID=109636 RepID=A0A9P5Z0G2_9AGAR|nr:hypothetical protein BDN70DRAFT_709576 [Pholiota conissans]
MAKNSASDKLSLSVYTTLNIPTVTSHPSLKSVQWSADGQVSFITKNAVVILTPDHGINFDTDSVIKSTPSKNDPALGWFKTMIQHDQTVPMKWPDYSQSWSATSLGSLDPAVTSVAISPSGLSLHGRCIFVTLSSNMDVNLWAAGKNYLKGEWSKIFEVTPYLLDTIAPTPEEKCTSVAVLQAQIVCIEWTPQVEFGVEPAPWLDASLLVVGSRSGHIRFLRYQNSPALQVVASLQVSEKWITQIAFCKWVQCSPFVYEGVLTYGTADGSVGSVKITQTLTVEGDVFSFTPHYQISVKVEQEQPMLYASEISTSITALRWVHPSGRHPVLITANPGVMKFYSKPDPEATYWTGHRTLRIQLQKISTDSSPFHPVSGLTYRQSEDRLVVTLFDGSFHVVRNLSMDPSWASKAAVDVESEHVTSETLSALSRATFEKAEKGEVDRGDMLRIDGAIPYDDVSVFLWVYESSRPSDFSYKHDAKHSSTLVVAQMWEADGDDILLNLNTLLTNVKASSRSSPLHLLRPFFLHLRNPITLDLLHSSLLETLQASSMIDHSTRIKLPLFDGTLDQDTRSKFRAALSTHLFGWDNLLSLRMRLSLADFAWKLSITEEKRSQCGVVAQSMLNAISHRILRTLIRHLVSVVNVLTADDIPFVSRIILQSLLHGCPPDLTEEVNQLSTLIQPFIETSTAAGSVSEGILNTLNESCPACRVEVPLQDITTAVCTNGHSWARCSVTTFILSTPWVRTCVGCSRKAFLPPSAKRGLPAIARGWVVEELLEAVHHCLFCNNHLVSIL